VEEALKELRQYWDQFLNSKIAKEYNKEVTMFEKWLRRMGGKLLMLRAREAADRGNPVAKDYPVQYITGLIRRGQAKILVNMFAAYLVEKGMATQYYLIKNKYVAGGESIATWLRVLRKM
jgi:hypothetical protein